jgi:hypothetical protein
MITDAQSNGRRENEIKLILNISGHYGNFGKIINMR